MNSVQKFSSLPLRFVSVMKHPVEVIPSKRGLGCVHVPLSRPAPLLKTGQPLGMDADPEQIVQLKSPDELKDVMGTDKYYAEKRGNEIIAFAATKKLLVEEKLRKTINSYAVPLDNIVQANRRWKPSTVRPICPVIHEEL
ncbi:hypothetical protein Ocin01_10140 [Orchesella cincta]|uniref:Uncharacterized protein n=1 Tax=Orchesella cincta TaxID=48709 RepID=A0A1D2MTY3_ORCCI|nr:hypothetical protein Ocin01_10140 [Orchesella cincta]